MTLDIGPVGRRTPNKSRNNHRRMMAVTVVAAATFWWLGAMQIMALAFLELPSHRRGLVSRKRVKWEDYIRPLLEDGSFKVRFRMSPQEFRILYGMLRSRLERQEEGGLGRNGTVAGEWALAATLQWLAGHGVCSGADGPRMAVSTSYAKIKLGLAAINACRRLRIRWPRTPLELRKAAQGFCRRTCERDPVLKQCVGAADGILIRIKKPSVKEHPCPDRFYSGHKKTVGLNYQVICDANYTVIAACCNTPGSTNDRSAWKAAGFDALVDSLPGRYYVIGDAAYPATNKMLVPYPGINLDPSRDAFNYVLSQGRMSIEQTFGIMMKCFPILWTSLDVPLTNTADVVHAITRIHNFLRKHRSKTPECTSSFLNEDGTLRSNRWATPASRRMPCSVSQTREEIRAELAERNYMRPPENIARNRRWRRSILRDDSDEEA